MAKTYGGCTKEQVQAMAPKWATHISTDVSFPDTFLFESIDSYQAYGNGRLFSVMGQEPHGMEKDAELLTEVYSGE